MKQSLTAVRMSEQSRRLSQPAKLNLVSLMDIFTILVFFLLLNSGDNQLIKNDHKEITLPASVSRVHPDETLVVAVSNEAVLVAGLTVATIDEVMASDGVIAGLKQALDQQASNRPELTPKEKQLGRAVTVMGDQELPYEVLKRVMVTCADADFRDLSLAVSQVGSAAAAGA